MTPGTLAPRGKVSRRMRSAGLGLLPWAIMLALLLQALVPGRPAVEAEGVVWVFAMVSPGWQNALHVVAYAVLCISWTLVLTSRLSPGGAALWGALIAIVFGAGIEWVQILVPGRFGNLGDILLNAAGAAAAAASVRVWMSWAEKLNLVTKRG